MIRRVRLVDATRHIFPIVSWGTLIVASLSLSGDMRDTGAYYNVRLDDMYSSSRFMASGYVYSPAFALLTEPFRWLPLAVMEVSVRVSSALALGYLMTPWIGLAMIALDFPGLRAELGVGNIDLIIGAVLVWVLWRPWLWSALLLTKVSPVVGLAWHLARREWRSLVTATSTTILVVLVSLPFAASAWPEWIAVLSGENMSIAEAHTGLPIVPRLVLGAALSYVAGYFGAAWLVPLAAAISFADPNPAHLLVGLAAFRLIGRGNRPGRSQSAYPDVAPHRNRSEPRLPAAS